MTRIVGPTGSKRRRRFLLGPILLASLAALFLVAGAQAVHDDGIFQLDRNAVTSDPGVPATTGEDWDKVCPSGTPAGAASCLGGTAATASFWTVDAVNAKGNDTTLYTGGATKDDLNINGGPGSGWLFTSGGGPDKDDLSDAYAARYADHLYFGTDRFSASGDSVVGIWFLQAQVGPITGGSKRGHFTGAHVNGDVLVLADFTQGGASVTARVFKWHSPGGAIDDTLDLIQGQLGTPADCVGPPQVPNGDNACATVNTENENSPWAFLAKESGATSGVFPPGHFFEGGIDLAGLNLANECFSSVIIESRASQSTDSVLKDFVAHTFQSCSATMETTPALADGTPTDSVTPGTAVHDEATVFGSNPTKDPSSPPNVNFFLCSFAVGSTATCDGTTNVGVAAGSVALTGNGDGTASASSPAVNTAASPLLPGHYCFRGEWAGDANYVGKLSDDGATECFDVAKINTQTVTTPVDGSGTPTTSITLGGSIFDKAVVTGTAAGGDPTGSVTFFVCKLDVGTCDGTINVGTQVGAAKTLASDGNANTFTSNATSDAFTPLSIGRYCFRGEYGGSTIYNPSSDSAATECFTVTTTSSTTSAQVWLPNDSATIHSGSGSTLDATNLSGTLSFTLHAGLTCTGTVLRSAETFTFSNASSPVSRSTTNTGAGAVTVSVTSNVSWEVVFTPTAGSGVSGSSRCESTALTITN